MSRRSFAPLRRVLGRARDPRVVGLGLALLTAGCAPAPATETVPMDAFFSALQASAPPRRTAEGVELEVGFGAGEAREDSLIMGLPGVRRIELDLRTDGPLGVVVGCYNGSTPVVAGPPFRTQDLRGGEARLAFDLSRCIEWRPESRPVLFLRGTARVLVRAVRVARAPADPEDFRALYDRATRWAPESLSGTTINFLTPPWWDSSRRSGLPGRLAAVAGGLGLAVSLAGLAVRRRPRPASALLTAALVATLGYDAWFAGRILPCFDLVPEPDPEVRIRDHLHNAPEVGALAALARDTLALDESVGVVGASGAWAGPQLLCFLLAPRECVLVRPGEEEHAGLSGVGRARLEELDALVVSGSDAPLPAGFERVARVNEHSYVARRR